MVDQPSVTQRMIDEFNQVRATDAYTGLQVLTLVMFAAGSGAALVTPYIDGSAQCVMMLGAVAAVINAPDVVTFARARMKSRRR